MERPLRPKVLGDISVKKSAHQSWSAYGPLPARVDLVKERVIRIPVTKTLRVMIIFAAAVFVAFGSAAAPTLITKASGDATGAAAASMDPAGERTQLESQLATLESQIDQYQGQISSYATQGKTLDGQISILNDKIASLNLEIQATNLTVRELNNQISDTQSQIATTQADIANKKAAMGSLMQDLSNDDQISLIQVFLQNPQLSDFWDETHALGLLQDNLRSTVQQITTLQSQLQDQEMQFQASKSDAASAAAYQAAQAAEVASTKDEKTQLLTETQGQESKYQTLLTATQASAAEMSNRIFELLGGGQLSFEQAYQYALVAGNATGIDPAFILAILDRESSLGQNVGQCNYQTAMSPSDQPLFLAITASLKLNPSEMMVSCPNADGAYGGAMGPAQFEPSTWNIYAPVVTEVTGDNPASPWNDADAFTATALYLKDEMAECQKVYSAPISQERCTAAKYYAGSRWQNYLWTYGAAVVEDATNFTADIQTITAGTTNNNSST